MKSYCRKSRERLAAYTYIMKAEVIQRTQIKSQIEMKSIKERGQKKSEQFRILGTREETT
jgi:hypothetical protein